MKKKRMSKSEATKKGNRLLRRLILVASIVFLVLFVFFTYLFVSNNRKIDSVREVINDKIFIVSRLDSNYLSALSGNVNTSDKLKADVEAFEEGLRGISQGNDGFPKPTLEQVELSKQVNKKWALIKPAFLAVAEIQEVTATFQGYMTDISVVVSDIKLASVRLKNNLDDFSNSKRVAVNLDKFMQLLERLDGVVQDFVKTSQHPQDTARRLNAYTQQAVKFVAFISRDLDAAGNNAFSAQEGSQSYALLKGKMGSLQAAVDVANKTMESVTLDRNTGLDTHETELLVLLRKLKDTYSATEFYPVPIVKLTSLHWIAICLSLTVVLTATWAFMLLTDARRLNKETTRLRIAAEERTKNDQEAILRLMDELADLSEGDLTIEAQVTEDFTGAIADSINFTVENMRDMVGTITHTSEEITRATAVSQDVSRLLTESSTEQSRQIDASADTVQQMASSLYGIAENTDASVEIAHSSVDMAQEGRKRVLSTIKSMGDIRENIQDTAKRIKRLGESSQEIGDIVEIIKGIADQTNVLALNAAIQATAAGEAGRGFAVVADEVQRLAERSANATKRIEVLVKTIQTDANEAVASMENSTKQVVTGADVAEEAGQSLDQIESVSKNLASLIVNVSKATRDAAGMAGDVATSMGLLADLNEKAVLDVTTSVRSVEALRELSASLKDSVTGFKLP